MKKNAVVLEKPSGVTAIRVDLSTTQREFYSALLQVARNKLRERDEKGNIFSVSLQELKLLLPGNYEDEYYINGLKELTRKTIEYAVNGDTEEYAFTCLVGALKVKRRRVKPGKESITLEFEIPSEIIRSLRSSKGVFADLNLVVVKGLKSKYAIALYEFVKDCKKTEITLRLEDFRNLFGVDDKYRRIDNLRRRVLDPAVREINENREVDFRVSYELVGDGRKHTHVRFTVKPREENKEV